MTTTITNTHKRVEQKLLQVLSRVLTKREIGQATSAEVERARRDLRMFYRSIEMHPCEQAG